MYVCTYVRMYLFTYTCVHACIHLFTTLMKVTLVFLSEGLSLWVCAAVDSDPPSEHFLLPG
jgi:hypothetical protein